MNRGIVICGGGYKYLPNAFIAISLLRMFGCRLPVELWGINEQEFPQSGRIFNHLGVTLRWPDTFPLSSKTKLPINSRWQWALKPWAILHSHFRHVLLLDADNFPTRNPEYLFDSQQYSETGALFWPDISITRKENPIWELLKIPFRLEHEFESGQMFIDQKRHRDPLEFALEMNLESEKYYKLLWGDKDTFRFSFYKFGRAFYRIPTNPQLLALPGRPYGGLGVMCQHDIEGRRIFQHRNLAKWDLLGFNPRIPGFLYEDESREFLGIVKVQMERTCQRDNCTNRTWTCGINPTDSDCRTN